ncbi:MarR family winged helix-turn-helix transcriptional regulator [Paenibacillus sp. 2TAB23]|uniref:MarR family winged helix-turn-helix transcriptional regulator n=1 Tax=Paenibacillus sp. 2TAB23 TaxID=3233004 RepID=UPI003F9C9E19
MYQPDDQNQLDLRLFRIWHKATKALHDNIRKDMENYGVSQEHFMILELLYSKGPQPIQKISEKFSIPSGSITYVIDKLEKKGYVRREPSATDRRGSNVKLTEEGQVLFDEIFPKHAAVISRHLNVIEKADKEQLIVLLKKVGLHAEAITLKGEN